VFESTLGDTLVADGLRTICSQMRPGRRSGGRIFIVFASAACFTITGLHWKINGGEAREKWEI